MTGCVFLGRYQAVRLLGEGGMGQVWFGRQLDAPREVVIKVIHPSRAGTARSRTTLEQEVALMSRLRHPNVVELLEGGSDPEHGPCIIMEYLPGISLELLRRREKRFPVARVGRWLGQLCAGLHAAHAAGIVHGDLKPENLMVLDAGESGERIKVMDFGLARLSDVPHIALDKLNGTCRHIGGGTPDYLSPEQIRGDGVDHRADIYSVGVLLFLLLTGRLPFWGREIADVLLAHVEKPPPRLADFYPGHGMPDGVEAAIQACLSKYPNERPQSARELAERFGEAIGTVLVDPKAFDPLSCPPPSRTTLPTVAPDDRSVVRHLEAWMPEAIAVVKLRGFAEDNGGEVVESVPGMVSLRFRDQPPPAPPQKGSRLLSLIKRDVPPPAPIPTTTMELHMQKKPDERQCVLALTVLLRPDGNRARASDPEWLALADRRFGNLRAYLMGRG